MNGFIEKSKSYLSNGVLARGYYIICHLVRCAIDSTLHSIQLNSAQSNSQAFAYQPIRTQPAILPKRRESSLRSRALLTISLGVFAFGSVACGARNEPEPTATPDTVATEAALSDSVAEIELKPVGGRAGTQVTVDGSGWRPGTMVVINLQDDEGESGILAATVANAVGEIKTDFKYPSNERWNSPDLYTIQAADRTENQNKTEAQFAVIEGDSSATAADGNAVAAATDTPQAVSAVPTSISTYTPPPTSTSTYTPPPTNTPTYTPPPTNIPTYTPPPTNTPTSTSLPTYTKQPTYTPQPTYTAPAVQAAGAQAPAAGPQSPAAGAQAPDGSQAPGGSQAPTYTPLPTYTTLPTYTPLPTYTALPTYTPVAAAAGQQAPAAGPQSPAAGQQAPGAGQQAPGGQQAAGAQLPTKTPIPTNTPTYTPPPTNTPTYTPPPTNTPTYTPPPTNTPTYTPPPTNTPANAAAAGAQAPAAGSQSPAGAQSATNTPAPPLKAKSATNTPAPPLKAKSATNTPVPPVKASSATDTPATDIPATDTPAPVVNIVQPATDTPVPTIVAATATSDPALSRNGIRVWRGDYWTNTSLDGPTTLRRRDEAINFDWGDGGPDPAFLPDEFSVRWINTINIESAGTYRFVVEVDDGARLFIDDELLLDNWRTGSTRVINVDTELTAGEHNITFEYFEDMGKAIAKLGWFRLVQQASAAAPPAGAWLGEYFDNDELKGVPIIVRNESAINFNWNTASPGAGIPSDNFSARWRRNIDFEAGTYRFEVEVDDGIRVWVGDNLIIDQWQDNKAATYTADVTVPAGKQIVRVEYFENTLGARAMLTWSRADRSLIAPTPTWTAEPPEGSTVRTLAVRVAESGDDAEQHANGDVRLGSDELEITQSEDEHGQQIIGLRFVGVTIPNDATVIDAFIELTTEFATVKETSLLFYGEAVADAAVFVEERENVSLRERTEATVPWLDVPAWSEIGETHRTPDLSSILNEIISQDDWSEGNAVVFIISGVGQRIAEAQDGNAETAANLVIQYRLP